jgi:hypothetical protein
MKKCASNRQLYQDTFSVLITGIGCVGKSSIRKAIADKYSDNVISVDLEADLSHASIAPRTSGKVTLAESVHGLENNPEQYDKILYILPPKKHLFFWLKRGWAWFSNGIIDLANPHGTKRTYDPRNLPIIWKIIFRNLFYQRKWVKEDLDRINSNLKEKTRIVSSIEEGIVAVSTWVESFVTKKETHDNIIP